MGVSLSEGLEADFAKLADNQGLVQAQVARGNWSPGSIQQGNSLNTRVPYEGWLKLEKHAQGTLQICNMKILNDIACNLSWIQV
jgi:hypothetical protein